LAIATQGKPPAVRRSEKVPTEQLGPILSLQPNPRHRRWELGVMQPGQPLAQQEQQLIQPDQSLAQQEQRLTLLD